MTINLNKTRILTIKEVDFLYRMLITHGYMPEATPSEEPSHYPKNKQQPKAKKPNPNKKKFVKSIDKTKPNLMNLNDPLWEKCKDINFLIFRVIWEKIKGD